MIALDMVRSGLRRILGRSDSLDPRLDLAGLVALADALVRRAADALEHPACGLCGGIDLRVACGGRRVLGRSLYGGSPALPRAARGLPMIYRECARCGAARIAPAPRAAWIDFVPNAEAEADAGHWMEDPEYVADKQRSIAVHHERLDLTRFQGPIRSVLDVSCGSGVGLATLRDRFAWRDCRGVECDPMAAAAGRQLRGLDVLQGLIHTVDLRPAHHDLVVFDNSLEHHADPRRALRCARRTLRPGGAVAIIVPNWHGFAVEVLGLDYWNLNWGHWHYFTVQSLAQLLETESFRVERAYCDGIESGVVASMNGVRPASVDVDLSGAEIRRLPLRDAVFRGDYITVLAIAV